jgi:ubiquitin carboxyl-terminal hydrolase 14
VKFPTEYDALDLVTDELKEKLQPVSRRLMEIEKERKERRKVRKRTKGPSSTAATSVSSANDVDMANEEQKPEQEQEGGRLAPESVFREREKTELDALISSDVKEDVGASATGLYDLVGRYSGIFRYLLHS